MTVIYLNESKSGLFSAAQAKAFFYKTHCKLKNNILLNKLYLMCCNR